MLEILANRLSKQIHYGKLKLECNRTILTLKFTCRKHDTWQAINTFFFLVRSKKHIFVFSFSYLFYHLLFVWGREGESKSCHMLKLRLDHPSLADTETVRGMDLGKNVLSVSIPVFIIVDSHLEHGLGTIRDLFDLSELLMNAPWHLDSRHQLRPRVGPIGGEYPSPGWKQVLLLFCKYYKASTIQYLFKFM